MTTSEPIRIVEIDKANVGTPRNDGTRGSALYSVPFRLSGRPTSYWSQAFVHFWNHPPRFTSMHRPGIASVQGDRIVLSGTTLEEVAATHRETLLLCVDEANKATAAEEERDRQARERKKRDDDEFRGKVDREADGISFD